MPDIKINLGENNTNMPGGRIDLGAPVSQSMASTATPSSPTPTINIFNQTKAKVDAPAMVNSIGANAAPKFKPILGDATNLQKTLQQDKEYEMKKKLKRAKMMLSFIVVIGMVVAGYFYTQLSPSFNFLGANLASQLNETNSNLEHLQAQLNKFRYEAAQIDINRFSYTSDVFFDKTMPLTNKAVSDDDKTAVATAVANEKVELPKILKRLHDDLANDLAIKTYVGQYDPTLSSDQVNQQYQQDLKDALNAEKADLLKGGQNDSNAEDVRLVDNTVKLVGSTKLINTIVNADADKFAKMLDDYLTAPDDDKRTALKAFVASILGTNKSDIATIGAIKATRINWTDVINEIENTKNSPDIRDATNDGNALKIYFTGYDFDSASGKIVLSGNTETNDAKNFSVISTLIDKLNDSKMFQNVNMRSFSKSGTDQTGYSANFKIDMELEKSTTTDSTAAKPATKVSLMDGSLEMKSGMKRLKDL